MTLSHESSISATPAGMGQAVLMDAVGARRHARRTDPETSHAAAAGASRFAPSHCDRIMAALAHFEDATAAELAAETGLTVVQIDRRMPDLLEAGRVCLVMHQGKPATRLGYRVWMRAGG